MLKKTLCLIVLMGCVALDLLSKSYIFQHYEYVKAIPVGFLLSWFPVYNTGMAWSIAAHYHGPITIVSIVLSCICLFEFIRRPTVFWGLVCAGGLANTFDRVVYGAVRDFIALSYGHYHFPIFNIADCYLSAGIFLLMLQIFRENLRQSTLLGDR